MVCSNLAHFDILNRPKRNSSPLRIQEPGVVDSPFIGQKTPRRPSLERRNRDGSTLLIANGPTDKGPEGRGDRAGL